jgi:hypothetical protein
MRIYEMKKNQDRFIYFGEDNCRIKMTGLKKMRK